MIYDVWCQKQKKETYSHVYHVMFNMYHIRQMRVSEIIMTCDRTVV